MHFTIVRDGAVIPGTLPDEIYTMLAFASVLAWVRLLYYLQFVRSIMFGPLVRMVIQIILDMRAFMVVVLVVLAGFACAFRLLLGWNDKETPYRGFGPSLMTSVTMGLFGELADMVPLTETIPGLILFILFMLFVHIIMLNLLIALRIQN
jgi:hypothetical protein